MSRAKASRESNAALFVRDPSSVRRPAARYVLRRLSDGKELARSASAEELRGLVIHADGRTEVVPARRTKEEPDGV